VAAFTLSDEFSGGDPTRRVDGPETVRIAVE
jgi:hypothetical protein